jgi:choline dehydrogenase-like flavoprotein
MDDLADVVVVGSGCAGAMAAQTLVEAGARTTLLCPGIGPRAGAQDIPGGDFLELRRSDGEQHRYLLGEAFEGIPWGRLGTGAQLTPPRKHLVREVETLLPSLSENFQGTESLAHGGLGGGWGLGCCVYSPLEIQAAGLEARTLSPSYQRVAQRVGISGENDDARAFTHVGLEGIQPAMRMDPVGQGLMARYARVRAKLNARGFHAGRTALALLTQPLGDRKAYAYRDLDFYSDAEGSAYRPWMTVDALTRHSNFQHERGWQVMRFEDGVDHVTVHARHVETRELRVFKARALVMASGVLGTARVVLRSLGGDARLPLLCNPYAYVACLQPALLGAHSHAEGVGFSQLSLFHDEDGTQADVAMASIYSYRSLMLFRLAKEVPLGLADAWKLLRFMMPALTIMGLHHPEDARHAGRLWLPADDVLRVDYPTSTERAAFIAFRGAQFNSAMRALGAWPLRKVSPLRGASIHYAGTLPLEDTDRPFTLHADGRLAGTRRVYVADASGFRFLPAKGPTLSLMAFADSVARKWVAAHG